MLESKTAFLLKSNRKLTAKDQLTFLIRKKGLNHWNDLTQYIKDLPYGRNANRTNFSLVLLERKGSCSSKHAFLKQVADPNHIEDVKLLLCIYKMNKKNTPKIGNALIKNNLDFIPEAHCYLSVDGARLDFTSKNSDFNRIENDILLEQEIEPLQVSKYKVSFHKTFMKHWIETENIPYTFETLWNIKETCISNLSL